MKLKLSKYLKEKKCTKKIGVSQLKKGKKALKKPQKPKFNIGQYSKKVSQFRKQGLSKAQAQKKARAHFR